MAGMSEGSLTLVAVVGTAMFAFTFGTCEKRKAAESQVRFLLQVMEEGRKRTETIRQQVKDLGPYTVRDHVYEELDDLNDWLNIETHDDGRD